MRIEPYIDPNGVPRERERAPYRVVLMSEGERHFIGFLPEGEGLTCLEFARIFSLALRPGTDPQEARGDSAGSPFPNRLPVHSSVRPNGARQRFPIEPVIGLSR